MSEAKHTPGPWVLKRFGAIVGGEPREYTNGFAQPQVAMACGHEAISPEEHLANAEFIVRAVNAHDDLVAALKLILKEYDEWKGYNDDGFEESALLYARAAIAKAEGRE